VEPGKPEAHLLANHHAFNLPVCSLRQGIVWLSVAVVAGLTPTVSRFIFLPFSLSLISITISLVGAHLLRPSRYLFVVLDYK
jgi:hypothetical protein